MKFTLSWLKRHLDTTADLATIAEAVTAVGLELEGVEDRAASLKPFVIAEVVAAEKHPNADRLRVCMVSTGTGAPVQVVCGAPNARAGMKGVFAAPGTRIPGTGVDLKVGSIRGVDSRGMLLSERELQLSNDHEGIIDLPLDAPVGANYADWAGLADPVIELSITPNRGDCLGVRGVARDLAAKGLGRLKPLDATPVTGTYKSPLGLRHDSSERPDALRTACPLFVARHFRGLKNGPSPRWLQDLLKAAGLRPISALVDITNFVSLDLCRPLHVFDAAKLDRGILVRFGRPGESLLALDGKTYALDGEMTVIADERSAAGIGGIMGGEETGCTPATTECLLEIALFDPIRTAQTGRKLAIHSDARQRFERGVDPAFPIEAVEIATRLILELCGGTCSEVMTSGAVPSWQRSVALRQERCRTLGGLDVPAAEQKSILESLGFTVSAAGSAMTAAPPPWRGDIVGEADLVEEVLRIKGFDGIPVVPLPRVGTVTRAARSPAQRRRAAVRRALADRGMLEAVSFSFMSSTKTGLFGAGNGEGNASVRLMNPISADLDEMRPSILPNLVDAAQRNADRGFPDLALCEIGPQYAGAAPDQQAMVAAGLRAGNAAPRHWSRPQAKVDAFMAKADAIAAIAAADGPVANLQVTADAPAWYHPGRSGVLRLGTKAVAFFGELHPAVLKAMKADGPMVACEVFLEALPPPKAKQGRARPAVDAPAFQPVNRDFAFVVKDDVAAEKLLRAARTAEKELVADVQVFDVYAGKGVPDGHKSLAIAVTLQPRERTLTDAEIEAVGQKIVAAVAKATGATLRS